MEINKMLRDELNIKYLSESRILRYLRNESSEEERFIVEKLRSNDINWENYALVKEMYEKGEFWESTPSEKESDKYSEKYKNEYNKFLKLVKKYHKPDPDFLVESHRLNDITEPTAGQIWLTKAIPHLAGYEFDPVSIPKYVYILSNPQPYQPLDEQDEVKAYKEYFTMLVLPVSIDTEFATHEDYIIESGNNILSIEFMIETWLETNMLVCNLEKCIGELIPNQIDELLNVYFAANSMDYDKDIYNKAKKGKFHDKDYGDIYEFRRIEEENIQYLFEPVNKLEEFFASKQKEGFIKLLAILSLVSKIKKIQSYYRFVSSSLDNSISLDKLWSLVDEKKEETINLYNDKNLIIDFIVLNELPHLIFYSAVKLYINSVELVKGNIIAKTADEIIYLDKDRKFITALDPSKLEEGKWTLNLKINDNPKTILVEIR